MTVSALQNKIIRTIIKTEGGYVDNPNDSGGKTKYGITERVARENGFTGNMKDLPEELAFSIYSKKYWDALMASSIENLSPSIAEELVDSGVNCGVGRAAEWLQRSLNALNRQQADYQDLAVDGSVGAKTIAALMAFLRRRGHEGELVLFRALNCFQGAHYIDCAEKAQKNETFVFGWFLNRVA